MMLSWLVLVTVGALPIGTRLLFAKLTPGFHEYEALFLYGSDFTLVLALLIAASMPRVRAFLRSLAREASAKFFGVFLLAAFISIFAAPSAPLALYSFMRLVFGAAFAYAVAAEAVRKKFAERVFLVLAVGAVLESAIALAQFKAQGSIGLGILGESLIGAADPGTSKVAVGSARLVRAYGTFPHPNVLAAFLLLGLLALFHFYLHTMRRSEERQALKGYVAHLYRRVAISTGIFLVAVGLTLTFSRAAWLTGFIGSLPFVIYGFAKSRERSEAQSGMRHSGATLQFLTVLLVINYLLFAMLGWAIFPRVQLSMDEPAVAYRLAYNRMGIDLIGQRPFGVGIGNQVLYAVERGTYRKHEMTESWQWQPIHNMYVLLTSEIGVFGLLGFLGAIAALFLRAAREKIRLEQVTGYAFLGALLILGVFDHFLWTLHQGRLMLWLVVGLFVGLVGRSAAETAATAGKQ